MNQQTTNKVFLGLGGNLGSPLDCFIEARQRLSDHPRIDLKASSPAYRTPAIAGPTGQPDYLNAILEIATDLSPRQLLEICLDIELACGRTREVRWAARTLDIDLLFFGQLLADEPQLTLPHPRLHSRHFVLLPLADLEPALLHPRLKRTVSDLLNDLPEPTGISKISDKWWIS